MTAVLIIRWKIQNVAMPTGRQKVSKAMALWVSILAGLHGIRKPKSGTMLPMMVADSNRHRASGLENGTTAATWEMVNGIKYLRCHRTVIVQPYKLSGTSQH